MPHASMEIDLDPPDDLYNAFPGQWRITGYCDDLCAVLVVPREVAELDRLVATLQVVGVLPPARLHRL